MWENIPDLMKKSIRKGFFYFIRPPISPKKYIMINFPISQAFSIRIGI